MGPPRLLRSLPCPLPAHSSVRPGAQGWASLLPPAQRCRRFPAIVTSRSLGSFLRPLLLASPERPRPLAQSLFWKCGAGNVGLSSHFHCSGVARVSRPGGKETCPVVFCGRRGRGSRSSKVGTGPPACWEHLSPSWEAWWSTQSLGHRVWP